MKNPILFPRIMIGAVAIGAAVAGGLYVAYKMGRIDQIDEFVNLVHEHGDMPVTVYKKGKVAITIMLKEM